MTLMYNVFVCYIQFNYLYTDNTDFFLFYIMHSCVALCCIVLCCVVLTVT